MRNIERRLTAGEIITNDSKQHAKDYVLAVAGGVLFLGSLVWMFWVVKDAFF